MWVPLDTGSTVLELVHPHALGHRAAAAGALALLYRGTTATGAQAPHCRGRPLTGRQSAMAATHSDQSMVPLCCESSYSTSASGVHGK